MIHFSNWEHAFTLLIIIIFGGLVVAKLTEKPRIPDVAAFLLFGILVGPGVFGLISEPSVSEVNQFILNIGATLILFDGGRGIEFGILRKTYISITMLATVGVLISAAVVGLAVHWLLGLPWLMSLLLGSVISSTDPATLIPVFRRVPIVRRLQQTVESESAFNDATGSVLVFTLVGLLGGGHSLNIGAPILSFLQSALVGAAVGLIFGYLALWLVSERGWGIFHDYGSIALLVLALGSFQISSMLGGSGLMAAFIAGVMTGNGESLRLPLSKHTEDNIYHFGSAITLLLRMLIFVLLGTQVNFATVHAYLWSGLIVVLIFMVIARPLSVLASVVVDRRSKWTRRETLFMFWVRETGVIPAALAGMLVAKGVPDADVLASITFMAILITILVQASTTGIVAKKLGLAEAPRDVDI